MSEEREILGWEQFGEASRELAKMVADDGFEPEMILSIARGGLCIGGALGYALAVKNTYTMNVEFYTGVDERLEVPRILPPAPDFVDLGQAKLLIVDDVADTGHTLKSSRLLRRQGRRSSHRSYLREVAFCCAVRLRLETNRPLDQFPLERQTSCGRT